MDWSDRSGCSLWKLSYTILACVRLCGTHLVHMFLFPEYSWRIWSVISHLLCSWFSINLTPIKLSLAINLWTSAAVAKFWAFDGHPPRVSPCRAITSLSQSFKLFSYRMLFPSTVLCISHVFSCSCKSEMNLGSHYCITIKETTYTWHCCIWTEWFSFHCSLAVITWTVETGYIG